MNDRRYSKKGKIYLSSKRKNKGGYRGKTKKLHGENKEEPSGSFEFESQDTPDEKMANHISRNDFENICRTCLSRKGLNPLYEKCIAEMLMACTAVKFAENDGFPEKICTNCINEINNAFSFAKRCETTDEILRKCIIQMETEVANTSSHQIVEPTIKTEVEIQPEIIYQYERMVEVKQEENLKMEFEENWLEVKAETKIRIKCNENDPLVESNENNDDDELQDETAQRRCTMSQREENNSTGDDSETYEDPEDESYEEDDDDEDQNQMYSKKHDNSGSRLKRKTFCPQTNEASTKNKMGQHKHDQHCKSSNQIKLSQEGIHTAEKPHICEVCSKGFRKKSGLKTHLRIHTGEKPYTCDVCSKDFGRNEQLQNHMRIHTGVQPYTCEVCSKAFPGASYLQIHMRKHTGEKPYTCDVCSKAFPSSSQHNRHMKIHTGEKPYACKVCSKTFNRSSILQQHMRIPHQVEALHL